MSCDIFHYKLLKKLRDNVYKTPLKESDITDIIAIEKVPYYLIQKKYTKYLIAKNNDLGDTVDDFPLIPVETEDRVYGNKVFKVIRSYKTINIKGEKDFSFKELIDLFAPFEHENPVHFLLYKIIVMTALIDRINVTVSTDASFGKDSIVDLVGFLYPYVSKVTPTSMASIVYRLDNLLLALNEISDLKKEDLVLLERFMATAGSFNNEYENPKRGSASYGTRDKYDISRLSLIVLYNNYEYFLAKKNDKKFFNNVFKDHIIDRFLSFRFDGVLKEDFSKVDTTYEKTYELRYKRFIKSIAYFVSNNPFYELPIDVKNKATEMMYSYAKEMRLSVRQKESYFAIAQSILAYTEGNVNDFEVLLKELNKAILGYKYSLNITYDYLRYKDNGRVDSFSYDELDKIFKDKRK